MKKLLGVFCLLGLFGTAWCWAQGEPPGWPPLPDGTQALILATGGDQGYFLPKGCNGRSGGARYRQDFDRWLSEQVPEITRFWLATGDLAFGEPEPRTFSRYQMISYFRLVGYSAIGLGFEELNRDGVLELLGPEGILGPFISANLIIHETGQPVFPQCKMLTWGERRVLVIGVSRHQPEWVSGSPSVGTIVTVPPEEVVRRLIRENRSRVDFVVLLSSLLFSDLRDLLETVDGIDLALASSGTFGAERPLLFGKTPVLWLGSEGQYLGRVALGPDGKLLEARTVRVQGDFPIDPLTGEPNPAPPKAP